MTIREKHIRIEGQLSQVNADRRRSFEPEEIDIAINTSIGQFVYTRAKQYAAGDMQSVEDIASLVVTGSVRRCYKTGDNTYMAIMPADLASLSHVRFLGKRICDGTYPELTSATLTAYRMQIPRTTKSTPNYYQTFLISKGGVLFSVADTVGWPGLTDEEGYFTLKKQLEWAGMRNDISYEGFGFLGKQGYLYSLSPFFSSADGVSTAATSFTQAVSYYDGLTQTIYGEAISPLLADMINETPFWKPNNARINYYPGQYQSLVITTPPDVILSSAVFSYIRKPAITDVILGIDCDLPDNKKVHELICKMAVRNLMGDTGDERYQIKAVEEAKDRNNNP